ncbi:hypothetical protein L6V77_33755, partial [Myxococcota bacterium]|nr:hypothetical protein [Myxococcota bacterium]
LVRACGLPCLNQRTFVSTGTGNAVRRALKEAGIQHILTFRAKDADSLRKKLEKDRDQHDFIRLSEEFAPGLKDVAGVRVMVYLPDDVRRATEAVERTFEIPDGDPFRKSFDGPGYRAQHRTVGIPKDVQGVDPTMVNLASVLCEVQITTILDHVWNELEHDIKYKTPNGTPSPSQSTVLSSLRIALDGAQGNVRLLVTETDAQIAAHRARPLESVEDLAAVLASLLGGPPSGEVGRLHQLLASTLRVVNVAELGRLSVGADLLRTGRERAAGVGEMAADDVCAIVAGLWEPFGEQFLDIARTWRGKPGPTKRMIDALRQPTRKEAEPDADT